MGSAAFWFLGPMRILLIEDNPALGEAVRDYLATVGHAVDWMQTLQDAHLASETVPYGLILLDLRLPDGQGLSLLKKLRTSKDMTPVIVLTALDQISDRIDGLNAGADDYLVKPFDLGELSARMLAVSRRRSGNAVTSVEVGNLMVNQADRKITDRGRSIELSGREWAVFEALLARPGALMSKRQIEETLYAFGTEIESNTVEVYVSRLRKKVGREVIETVRGVGYRLKVEGEEQRTQ